MRQLLTDRDIEQLRANRAAQLPVQGTENEIDHMPVCRLFIEWTGCVWLLSELDEDGNAFGLCDLGQGFPELGPVSLEELAEIDVRGLRVQRDNAFRASMTISQYATRAQAARRIIT